MFKLEEKIKEYKKLLDATSDIVLKMQYEESMQQLVRKKEDWTANKPVYDYFFETGEILYNYYDLQEKIQKGDSMMPVRVVKAKPGSVLAALQEGAPDQGKQEQKSSHSKNLDKSQAQGQEGREVLLEKYLRKVDPEHAKATVTTSSNRLLSTYCLVAACKALTGSRRLSLACVT